MHESGFVFRSPFLFIGLILSSLVVLKLQGDRVLLRAQGLRPVSASGGAGREGMRNLSAGVEDGAMAAEPSSSRTRVNDYERRGQPLSDSQGRVIQDTFQVLDQAPALPPLVVESLAVGDSAVRTPSSQDMRRLPLRIERLK